MMIFLIENSKLLNIMLWLFIGITFFTINCFSQSDFNIVIYGLTIEDPVFNTNNEEVEKEANKNLLQFSIPPIIESGIVEFNDSTSYEAVWEPYYDNKTINITDEQCDKLKNAGFNFAITTKVQINNKRVTIYIYLKKISEKNSASYCKQIDLENYSPKDIDLATPNRLVKKLQNGLKVKVYNILKENLHKSN